MPQPVPGIMHIMTRRILCVVISGAVFNVIRLDMQSRSLASSSDDRSHDEEPEQLPQQTAVQELHRRITHSTAPHSSGSDEDHPARRASSDLDIEQSGGDASGDETSESDDGNGGEVSMGERVANLTYGPTMRRRRQSSTPTGRGPGPREDMRSGHEKCDTSTVIKRRMNKHAPVEERISRRPVSVIRDSVQKKSVKPQDPRFLSRNKPEHQRDIDLAQRRYAFLYDKAIPAEVKELQAAMRKASDVVEQRRMQVKLSRLQQSLKQHEDRSLELEVESEWKMSQRAKLEAGRTPYYMKESEKKQRVLEKKFARLEETGQLEKYMSKKRKRVASKKHKKLPFRRMHQ